VIALLQLKLEGRYAFESLAIKTTEKRLDGFSSAKQRLVELFELAIAQRFPELTEEEVVLWCN